MTDNMPHPKIAFHRKHGRMRFTQQHSPRQGILHLWTLGYSATAISRAFRYRGQRVTVAYIHNVWNELDKSLAAYEAGLEDQTESQHDYDPFAEPTDCPA